MTTKNKQACDLCGQQVEISGFSLNSRKGELAFCCAGCQSIFQLLNEDLLLPNPIDNHKIHEDKQK
jgi:rRNA maturation endonuclease Nob1